jgi:hypothetical protein
VQANCQWFGIAADQVGKVAQQEQGGSLGQRRNCQCDSRRITQRVAPSVPVDRLCQELAGILHGYSDEARVRLMMTAGGQFYTAIEPLRPLPAEVYLQGVKVVTTGIERQTPRLKSTAFIAASEGIRTKIEGSDTFEALIVQKGLILEGMTSNIFYIKEGKLGTARKGILLGVTRRTVLRVARGSGLEIVYRPLKQEQVPALDVENLIIPFVKLIIRKVSVALGDLDIAVTGQFLRQLKIAGCAQHGGDKVVSKGMRGNGADGFLAQGLPDAFCDDVTPGCGRDGFDLFSGSLVVPGKERQGGQLAVGSPVQAGAG